METSTQNPQVFGFNTTATLANNSLFQDESTSAMAARMRKMTLQEDSAVCSSIISMPKTPYLRYVHLINRQSAHYSTLLYHL